MVACRSGAVILKLYADRKSNIQAVDPQLTGINRTVCHEDGESHPHQAARAVNRMCGVE